MASGRDTLQRMRVSKGATPIKPNRVIIQSTHLQPPHFVATRAERHALVCVRGGGYGCELLDEQLLEQLIPVVRNTCGAGWFGASVVL
jgi:hypothetical protein